MPSQVLNALAVGNREQAAIAVTAGLLERMTARELAGILGHEVSHLRHNDTQVMALADLVSRLTGLFSLFGQILVLVNLPLLLTGHYTLAWGPILLLLFAPNLSALLQLALSRTREFNADLGAAALTGDPAGLASALAKLERYQGNLWSRLFLPGRREPDPSLLRTHPPTEERVRRLLALLEHAPRPAWADFADADTPPARPLPGVRRAPRWHVGGLWY